MVLKLIFHILLSWSPCIRQSCTSVPGGQKRQRSATMQAACGGTLPAECSERQNWGWEATPVVSSLIYSNSFQSVHYRPCGTGLKHVLYSPGHLLIPFQFWHGNGTPQHCCPLRWDHREWKEKLLSPSSNPCIYWSSASYKPKSDLKCITFGTRGFINILYMLYNCMNLAENRAPNWLRFHKKGLIQWFRKKAIGDQDMVLELLSQHIAWNSLFVTTGALFK